MIRSDDEQPDGPAKPAAKPGVEARAGTSEFLALGTRDDVPSVARGTRDGLREEVLPRRRPPTVRDELRSSVLAIVANADDYAATLEWIRRRGASVRVVSTGEQGLCAHRESGADLVLVGLPLPDHRAASITSALRAADPHATIVLVGRDVEVGSQLSALELGADEYVADVVEARRDLLAILGIALGIRRSDSHFRLLRTRDAANAEWRRIVASSPAMRDVMRRLRELCDRSLSAATPTVLFVGEVGTGKHFLAKALH